MVSIKKRVRKNQTYYYLEHCFRDGKRIEYRERYLGKELPHDIEKEKHIFKSEIYREQWFDRFDAIKNIYAGQVKTVSISEKDIGTFIVKFTYNTNRIEGSSLTYRETALLLEKGITPNARPISDVKEAEAHRNTFYEILRYKKDITLDTVLYFHRKLFEQTKSDIAGQLRQHQVAISGSKFITPFPAEVYPLMMDFFKWYVKNRAKTHPVELAALVHLKLVTIHPFADGNGRISRLMMNFVLNRYGYPMLDIPYTKRAGYYTALERSQVGKEDDAFLQWFYRRYFKEHVRYLNTP